MWFFHAYLIAGYAIYLARDLWRAEGREALCATPRLSSALAAACALVAPA
jgi:hypothetical protein